MTACLSTKTTSSGRQYYYVLLRYKDAVTKKWKVKYVKTGLLVKNNKKKALGMIDGIKKKYAYLEREFFDGEDDPTMCWYLDHWLEDRATIVRSSTMDGYEYRVKRLKRHFEKHGNPLVSEMTSRELNKLFTQMLKSGKTNKKTGEGEALSVRSVRSYKCILRSMFDLAVVENVIDTNPAASVRVGSKANKSYRDGYLFLTEEEVSRFLEFLSDKYEELLGIAFFGIYYGLRRSEILGLKWSAIDYKNKLVSINFTRVKVGKEYAEETTKTAASRRSLDLFDTAVNCLEVIKRKQEADKRFFKSMYQNRDGYVFCWRDGRPYSPDYVTKKFKKAATEFGRPDITLHKLRHTCASILISRGWDIKRVQHWLGH